MSIVRRNSPRGLRNANPLNIRLNPANKWEGRIPVAKNTDGEFEQFSDPVFGLRAAAILIRNHAGKGADTIARLIRTWAPPNENDTIAYTAKVARLSGIRADQQVDFRRYDVLKPVLVAMIQVENGRNPYPDELADEALARAGVRPPMTTTIGA